MCLFFRFCKPRSKTNIDVFSVISSKNHNLKVFYLEKIKFHKSQKKVLRTCLTQIL